DELPLEIAFMREVFGCGAIEARVDVVRIERGLGDDVGLEICAHHHGGAGGDVDPGFGRPVEPEIVQQWWPVGKQLAGSGRSLGRRRLSGRAATAKGDKGNRADASDQLHFGGAAFVIAPEYARQYSSVIVFRTLSCPTVVR